VIGNGWIRRFALRHGLGELWLRSPFRFRYLLIIAFAGLAAYGLQAWLDRPPGPSFRDVWRRGLWFVLPLLVFVALPIAAGSRKGPYVELAVGVTVIVSLLLLAARGRTWAVVA